MDRSSRDSGDQDDGDDASHPQSTGPPPSLDEDSGPTEPTVVANTSLFKWVRRERFPLFAKVTRGRFNHVLSTEKLVALAVLEENKIGELTPEMEEFREMLRSIAVQDQRKYRERLE